MAINPSIINFETEVLSRCGLSYLNLDWCEFGNQKWSDRSVAKYKYEDLGVKHTSIDVNGLDGSWQFNLNIPLPSNLYGRFDVVTNYGTLEHVSYQYSGFYNMHKICKLSGIVIHSLPVIGKHGEHGFYHYSNKFMFDLYQALDYTHIHSKVFCSNNGFESLLISFQKKQDEFISKSEFDKYFEFCSVTSIEKICENMKLKKYKNIQNTFEK